MIGKERFTVGTVTKAACHPLLQKHHYLSAISKGFKSGLNIGLLYEDRVIGVCIFTGWPVPELLTGCFGLERTDQDGFWELSRLVLDPEFQRKEHNLASWFVSRSIRLLRKTLYARAILSYADADFHQGTVYAASNFVYYGMSAEKKDFWIEQPDGSFIKQSRGKTKGINGEWRPRSRKHRFLKVFDSSLVCKWEAMPWRDQAIPPMRSTHIRRPKNKGSCRDLFKVSERGRRA